MTRAAPLRIGYERGFSLVAAVFIIVILALLGTTMVILNVLQRETVNTAVQGARAYHAARSGVEAGLFRCLGVRTQHLWIHKLRPVRSIRAHGLGVAVNCSESTHREYGTNYRVFVISSTATTGTFGSPDYVERMLRITATNASSL